MEHSSNAPRSPVWRNSTGTSEHPAYIGARGRRLFSVLHLPAGEPRLGVVVCSPIKLELMRNYRREVRLGRRLAELGVAVQRFHYRGEGHSDGDDGALSLQTMIDDGLTATSHLASTTGLSSPVVVGTRVGALVAARVAAEHGSALVAWQPVLRPRAYFRELLRARGVAKLKGPEEPAGETVDLAAELDEAGRVEILGFSIDRPLYDTLENASFEELVSERPFPVLLGEGGRKKMSSASRALESALVARHFDVEGIAATDEDADWWFPSSLSIQRTVDEPFVEIISDWIGRRFTTEVVA